MNQETINQTFLNVSNLAGKVASLLNDLESIATSSLESPAHDEFPKTREDLFETIQFLIDLMAGEFKSELAIISDAFAKTVLASINLNEGLEVDPEVLARTNEWVEPGEGIGYVRITDILQAIKKYMDGNVETCNPIALNATREQLYVPTILANTVGYAKAIHETYTADDVDEHLHFLDVIAESNVNAFIGKYRELQEAIMSPQMNTIMVASGTDNSTRETALEGMKAFVAKGKELVDQFNQFLSYIKCCVEFVIGAMPLLQYTMQTVDAAYALYRKHLDPTF